MPIANETDHVAPSEINIGSRQRSEAKTGDLIGSIKLYGILNPIIVRREANANYDKLTLVAGHRRLLCALELKLIQVPIRYYDTLDEDELQVIELEENIKREDLFWKDRTSAIGNFHNTRVSKDPSWTITKTAEAISYTPQQISNVINVFNSLDKPAIANADNFSHALGILQRLAERVTSSLVEELLRVPGSSEVHHPYGIDPEAIFTNEEEITPSEGGIISQIQTHGLTLPEFVQDIAIRTIAQQIPNPIIVADFIEWSKTYSGPKFNLIHCDFPYGVNAADATIEHYENNKQLFWNLTNALIDNFDNFVSYSAHVMFWLSFEYYEEVKAKLSQANLHVINRPLIWVKSNSQGAAPGIRGTQPRHSYEICFLAYRGNRPLVKQGTDSYAAPTVISPIHPTQKPESMLKHFLSMLVDNVTDFLDPTAGSGSAIRAAEDLGARYTLGIEIDPEYASAANAITLRERAKRKASEELRAMQKKLPDPHPWYGPCDGLGPDNSCAECAKTIDILSEAKSEEIEV